MRIYAECITPNVLVVVRLPAQHDPEPGRMGGGPVPVSQGFPTVREPHRPEGNRGKEAFGNDEL